MVKTSITQICTSFIDLQNVFFKSQVLVQMLLTINSIAKFYKVTWTFAKLYMEMWRDFAKIYLQA